MPPTAPHRAPDASGGRTALAGIGAALLVILCCAGPALLATGVLAGIGAWLAGHWAIPAVLVLLTVAVTALPYRRRTSRAACCPPTASAPDRADQSRPRLPARVEDAHRP